MKRKQSTAATGVTLEAEIVNSAQEPTSNASVATVAVDPPAATPMSTEERLKLESCEADIRASQTAVRTARRALRTIRDERLYRDSHRSFDAYCRQMLAKCRRTIDTEIRIEEETEFMETEHPGARLMKELRVNPGLARVLLSLTRTEKDEVVAAVEKAPPGTRITRKRMQSFVETLRSDANSIVATQTSKPVLPLSQPASLSSEVADGHCRYSFPPITKLFVPGVVMFVGQAPSLYTGLLSVELAIKAYLDPLPNQADRATAVSLITQTAVFFASENRVKVSGVCDDEAVCKATPA